jgi:regulatory protein
MGDDPRFDQARRTAFRLLSLRGRSVQELRSKLLEKGFENPVVSRVLLNLQELQVLDDAAFARERARSLAANRLCGNRRIEVSLREKGISSSLIKEALAAARKELPEREALSAVMRKKLKGRALADLDRREKQRLARSLLGKGFPTGLIFDFLRTQEEGSFDERE